jgi:6-phosphogluconolactonase
MVSGRAPEIWIGEDGEALAREGVRRIVDAARRAILARGRFVIALAGGNTPRRLYQLLANVDTIDWTRVHVCFSDERMVSHDHPDSNYKMASDALLRLVRVPPSQIHPVPTDLSVEDAAQRYDQILREVLISHEPRLDLALLGMGSDGHTASIFPGSRLLAGVDDDFLLDDPSTGPLSSGVPTPSLDSFASERLCAAVYDAPKPPSERVTMTPYVLNLARQVLVLVAGDDKVAAVSAALESDARVAEIPIRAIAPATGELVWLLDRKAGRALGNPMR